MLPLLGGALLAAVLSVQAAGAASGSVTADRAASGPGVTQGNSASFADAANEDVLAPDIRTIVVSNTNGGLLTFKVAIPNRPALTSDGGILIDIDADANLATGDPKSRGAEYSIEVGARRTGEPYASLFKWTGSKWDRNTSQRSLTFSYVSGVTANVGVGEIGNSKKINFSVVALSGIAYDANGNPILTNVRIDYAPNTGTYRFDIIRGARFKVAEFSYDPTSPEAGATLVAQLAIIDSVTGKPPAYDSVTCRGTVGGRSVQTFDYVRRGVAVCDFRLPDSAGGRTLNGSVSARLGAVTLERTFRVAVERPHVVVEIGKVTRAPHQPEAGGRFYMALGVFVTTGANGKAERITNGAVTCRATIGGRPVHTFEKIVLRALGVRCGWDIPSSAEGQVLVCTVKVKVGNATVSKTFRFTVR